MEDEEEIHEGGRVQDEAEIYEGARAQFPFTFGKQSKPQTSLEAIHNTTRRSSSSSHSLSNDNNNNNNNKDFPSLSPSSNTWLSSVRKTNLKSRLNDSNPKNPNSATDFGPSADDVVMVGPPPPPPASDEAGDDVGGMIGPPRLPSGFHSADDDEGMLIGPPRPPPASAADDDDDDLMIGPPRPPVGLNSAETDSDDGDLDNEEEQHRIPLSNEIVLKGHSKKALELKLYQWRMREEEKRGRESSCIQGNHPVVPRRMFLIWPHVFYIIKNSRW